MSKDKKRFSETKVGSFLQTKAPDLAGDIIGLVGDITGVEILSKIGDKISKSTELTPEDKALALALLEMDKQEMSEISNRWNSDMVSDSWLSKNVRPLVLIYLIVVFTALVVCDSLNLAFAVSDPWIQLLEYVLITVITAYFGSRGFEKFNKIKHK